MDESLLLSEWIAPRGLGILLGLQGFRARGNMELRPLFRSTTSLFSY